MASFATFAQGIREEPLFSLPVTITSSAFGILRELPIDQCLTWSVPSVIWWQLEALGHLASYSGIFGCTEWVRCWGREFFFE